MKFILSIILIFAFQLRGVSQAAVITKNFKFSDGVYLTLEDWQRNRPNFTWDEIETRLAIVSTTFQTHIEYLKFKKDLKDIDMEGVWGIVLDGIPYVRLPKDMQKKTAMVFAGMMVRGRLCYFQYDDIEEVQVPITAYIPQTGKPYITKNIIKKESVLREKVLRFEDGKIYDLTLNNFKTLISDDKDLVDTFNDLKPNEITEKLFKVLLIFNDRNPVFLK
jgi:hypothetical protein